MNIIKEKYQALLKENPDNEIYQQIVNDISRLYDVDEIVSHIMDAEIPMEMVVQETRHKYGLRLLDCLCEELKEKL